MKVASAIRRAVLAEERTMSADEHPLATEVSSDFRLFDPYRRCLACDQPAQHRERGAQHRPVLAGGVCIAGGGFRQLAVLCSACVSERNLERCLWAARKLAGQPRAVCFVYQLVGPSAAISTLRRFVAGLRRFPPSAPQHREQAEDQG